MVNHKLETLLKSWVDDELAPEQAAEVAGYLRSNPDARVTVTEYRRIAELLRTLAHDTPIPIPCPEEIVRRARQREQEERQMIRWLQRLAAVAAVLLIATVGVLFSSVSAGERSAMSDLVAEDPFLDHDQAWVLALNDPSWEEDPQ